MDCSREEDCALLLLAEEKEKAAMPGCVIRLRSHRSRLFGYTVYVLEGKRILEIKHYYFLIPGQIGGHYSKNSCMRV